MVEKFCGKDAKNGNFSNRMEYRKKSIHNSLTHTGVDEAIMSYQVFPSGPFETNAYLLFCPATKEAVIIDPAPGSAEKLIKAIEDQKLKLKEIWLTHSHWDHFADAASLLKKFPVGLAVQTEDALNVQMPGSDLLPCWIAIEGINPTRLLQDQDKLKLGHLDVEVIYTPGHTPGGVCFYLPEKGLLFSGDTLFKGTIGNLSFPTAQPSFMWQSLKKLAKLPAKTIVLPGHGPSTTIENEPWLADAEQYFMHN